MDSVQNGVFGVGTCGSILQSDSLCITQNPSCVRLFALLLKQPNSKIFHTVAVRCTRSGVTRRVSLTILHAVAIVTRSSVIIADIIVVVITWVRMHGQVREGLRLKLQSTTSSVMLAAGAETLLLLAWTFHDPILSQEASTSCEYHRSMQASNSLMNANAAPFWSSTSSSSYWTPMYVACGGLGACCITESSIDSKRTFISRLLADSPPCTPSRITMF